MPEVSVIIPVHNTEALLDRTLGSLVRQTLRDIEILCVDDGSTDGSLGVLQAWAQKDPRIRVIAFPQNRGVAAARNAGFAESRGDYVYYLDSDDWIDDDHLAAMQARALETGQDVVVNANYVQAFEDPAKDATSGNFGFIEGDGFYPAPQVQTFFPPVIWARLYKRAYLQRIGIAFPDVKSGEDIYYAGLAELLQPCSYVFRGPFHHYWQREGSLFHQKTNGFHYIQSFKLLYDELLRRGVPTEEIRLFYAGPMILDTQEKFDFVRAFLLDIEAQVRRHTELYVAHDLFLLDAVCGSSDYADFLSRHNPNIALAFIRSRMKSMQRNG